MAPLNDGPWPLKVSQRCLSILARVLLARQQKALQANTGMDIAECVKVWNRLIDTLGDSCLTEEELPVTQGLSQFICTSIVVISHLYDIFLKILIILNVFNLISSDQSKD